MFRICFVLFVLFAANPALCAELVDFNRDIRPILSDKCFHCHGPDASNQDSELRFDTQEHALADLGGYFAIVPGDLEESELHRRIHADDESEVMPPRDSNRSLSKDQIALLDAWIGQGAAYDKHWSLKVPTAAKVPDVNQSDWPRNKIDYFILSRLESEQLEPTPEAKPLTLLRRVTLDLTGLPPTPEEVETFLSDRKPGAYERAVDRLLKSPSYGERMALPWLDAARYADSAGYQNDFKRSQWPWRDWVIDAYNNNLPFDQFTIQQLAGDLLENPTNDQLLATAFHRNHRINNEGGIIPADFLVEYVADRVETTATVWLGLTMGCARCHDHKYDPITQKDFYSLFAFFHNIPEKGKDGDIAPEPSMAVYTKGSREQHEQLKQESQRAASNQLQYRKQANATLIEWTKAETGRRRDDTTIPTLPPLRLYYTFDKRTNNGESNLGNLPNRARYLGPKRQTQNRKAKHGNGVFLRQGGYVDLGRPAGKGGYEPSQPMTFAAWVKPGPDVSGIEGPIVSCLTSTKAAKGFQINLVETESDQFQVAFRLHSNREKGESIEVVSKQLIPAKKFSHVAVTYDGSTGADGVAIYIDGENVPTKTVRDQFSNVFTTQEKLLLGAEVASSSPKTIRDELLANTDIDDVVLFHEVLSKEQLSFLSQATPQDVLLVTDGQRSKGATDYLAERYFQEHDPEYVKLLSINNEADAALKEFESQSITRVSIMREMKSPRDTYVLDRGVYDQPITSEKLQPATPDSILPLGKDVRKDRLGLANWLFDQQNPLTARVAVNRYWQMYFGTGLVKTSEDFGSQGEPPSHPELLDWLAIQFRESGWNVKAMQKLIVTSATYRQASRVTNELLQKDPENRLLARGPRFRLYPQALRDQALAVSGLLVDRKGGPPVMPYQPDGLWEEVSAKGFKYIQEQGDGLYRRSLYTFWRRTVPPPSMMNFDNASREACSVKSSVTNTPLQAMNLMNDPTYVESARRLAQRMMNESSTLPASRIRYGYRLVLAREPSERVSEILRRGYDKYMSYFQSDPNLASELVSVGESSLSEDDDVIELASLTSVASVLLNLDETVTKE